MAETSREELNKKMEGVNLSSLDQTSDTTYQVLLNKVDELKKFINETKVMSLSKRQMGCLLRFLESLDKCLFVDAYWELYDFIHNYGSKESPTLNRGEFTLFREQISRIATRIKEKQEYPGVPLNAKMSDLVSKNTSSGKTTSQDCYGEVEKIMNEITLPISNKSKEEVEKIIFENVSAVLNVLNNLGEFTLPKRAGGGDVTKQTIVFTEKQLKDIDFCLFYIDTGKIADAYTRLKEVAIDFKNSDPELDKLELLEYLCFKLVHRVKEIETRDKKPAEQPKQQPMQSQNLQNDNGTAKLTQDVNNEENKSNETKSVKQDKDNIDSENAKKALERLSKIGHKDGEILTVAQKVETVFLNRIINKKISFDIILEDSHYDKFIELLTRKDPNPNTVSKMLDTSYLLVAWNNRLCYEPFSDEELKKLLVDTGYKSASEIGYSFSDQVVTVEEREKTLKMFIFGSISCLDDNYMLEMLNEGKDECLEAIRKGDNKPYINKLKQLLDFMESYKCNFEIPQYCVRNIDPEDSPYEDFEYAEGYFESIMMMFAEKDGCEKSYLELITLFERCLTIDQYVADYICMSIGSVLGCLGEKVY
jgi:hypothetical protein